MYAKKRLVIVSNRVPKPDISETVNETSTQSVSGLVNGLHPALKNREGLWFGWSGKAVPCQENNSPQTIRISSVDVVTVDLSIEEVRDFYTGFCIRTLWSLFMCFPDRLNINCKEYQKEYQAYRHVNRYFAATLFPLLNQDDIVWVHDYQHIPIGTELRRLGWTGRLGRVFKLVVCQANFARLTLDINAAFFGEHLWFENPNKHWLFADYVVSPKRQSQKLMFLH